MAGTDDSKSEKRVKYGALTASRKTSFVASLIRIHVLTTFTKYLASLPILLGFLLTANCTNGRLTECPELASLVHRDPIQDAKAAFASGDSHLLLLGGFVHVTPGVESTNLPTREIQGTSDTSTEACRAFGRDAETYATKYNQTIASLQREFRGPNTN